MRIHFQHGFTYLALLLALALIGAGLAAKGIEWNTAAQRDRETDLLFIGEEFQEAIALYYYRTPGQVKEYPKSLDDLIEDSRFPGTQRYLRQVYRDPMTGKREWGLVLTPSARIMGVYSLSKDKPLKSGNFDETRKDFSGKTSYAEWQFVFIPTILPSAGTAKK